MILNLPDIAVKGINVDISPWDLPPEYISDGMNFKIAANAIVTYGSYTVQSTAPTEYNPAYAIFVRSSQGNYVVSAGTKIYAYQEGYTDISGTVSISEEDVYLWSGCLNGAVAILNNKSDYPVYWYGGDASVTDLQWDDADGVKTTWREKGYTASVIREHKNYLIAMDLSDDIARPDSFRWSHSADENGLPFTWNEQNTSGNAGVQALGGDGGRIIDGLTLRDSFIIYSQNAIHVLDLSGDEFVWRVRSLDASVGLLSKDCVVQSKGMHYLLTSGDIVMCDGNQITSIAHSAIQDILRGMNTEFAERAFAFSNDKNKEIWFCIPEGADINGNIHENVSLALIYQWKQGTWAMRELPEETSYLFSAPDISQPGIGWDSDTDTWDTSITRWSDGVSAKTFAEKPYAINYDTSEIQLLEPEETINDLNTFIERTDLAIGDQVSVTTLTRLYPHMYGSQPMRIRVGSQDRAGGVVRWKDWVEFDPDSQRKVDVRTTGALHCYRIESIGTGKFRFAGIDIEYEQDGVR